MISKQRNALNRLVSTRKTVGFFKRLIEEYLFNKEIKFREFSHVINKQLYFTLSLVKENLTNKSIMQIP